MEPTAQIPGLLEVLAPAVGAGAVAVLATVAVERLGGAAGGVVSSIPTTIVPAAIGIHASSPDEASFRRAMCFVPVGILLNAGYLLLWRVLPARIGMRSHRHLLAVTVTLALGAWLVAAAGVVAANDLLRPGPGAALAIADVAVARWRWERGTMMTAAEAREERRASDGDPEAKQRRRHAARRIAGTVRGKELRGKAA